MVTDHLSYQLSRFPRVSKRGTFMGASRNNQVGCMASSCVVQLVRHLFTTFMMDVSKRKLSVRDFQWLRLQASNAGAWVQSLIGELRSCMLSGVAKKGEKFTVRQSHCTGPRDEQRRGMVALGWLVCTREAQVTGDLLVISSNSLTP